MHDCTPAACKNMPWVRSQFLVSLTWNCHLSKHDLGSVHRVVQHACPWQPGSGESIWVRKDNPLTPKEDWRISQALMSCELVFISHHKNGAVCVAAREHQQDHRVTESIMRNCYHAGASGRNKEQAEGYRRRGGWLLRMFWCICFLSCGKSRGLERWCDNGGCADQDEDTTAQMSIL